MVDLYTKKILSFKVGIMRNVVNFSEGTFRAVGGYPVLYNTKRMYVYIIMYVYMWGHVVLGMSYFYKTNRTSPLNMTFTIRLLSPTPHKLCSATN